jgi:hypothetical protein
MMGVNKDIVKSEESAIRVEATQPVRVSRGNIRGQHFLRQGLRVGAPHSFVVSIQNPSSVVMGAQAGRSVAREQELRHPGKGLTRVTVAVTRG